MSSRLTRFRLGFLALVPIAATGVNAAPPLEFDCDAAPGAYSDLKQVSASGYPVAVSGKVTFVKARADQKWLPGASVSLNSKSGDLVMFRVAATDRDQGQLRLQLLTRIKGKDDLKEVGTAKLDEVTRFAITSTSSAFSVVIGDRSYRVEVDTGNDWSTEVTCTTGEFLYTDLLFGG